MRVIETTVYKFEELSDEAKDRAIEKYQSKMNVCELALTDGDCYNLMCEEAGFLNSEIEYSGFYSQGDGASFMADIDTESFLVGKYECLKELDFHLEIRIRRNNTYHEYSKVVVPLYVEDAIAEEHMKLIEELSDEVEQLRVDLCHDIYRALEIDYEYQTSNEAISETLIANEYEFDEQGNMV